MHGRIKYTWLDVSWLRVPWMKNLQIFFFSDSWTFDPAFLNDDIFLEKNSRISRTNFEYEFFLRRKKNFFFYLSSTKNVKKKKYKYPLCLLDETCIHVFLLLVNTIRIAGRRKMFISLNWRWFIAESCTFSKYGKYRTNPAVFFTINDKKNSLCQK